MLINGLIKQVIVDDFSDSIDQYWENAMDVESIAELEEQKLIIKIARKRFVNDYLFVKTNSCFDDKAEVAATSVKKEEGDLWDIDFLEYKLYRLDGLDADISRRIERRKNKE